MGLLKKVLPLAPMDLAALATAYATSDSSDDEEPHDAKKRSSERLLEGTPREDHITQEETRSLKRRRTENIHQTESTAMGHSVVRAQLPPPPCFEATPKDSVGKSGATTAAIMNVAFKLKAPPEKAEALFLPRQIRMREPNISTEDIDSYGFMRTKRSSGV